MNTKSKEVRNIMHTSKYSVFPLCVVRLYGLDRNLRYGITACHVLRLRSDYARHVARGQAKEDT